MAVRDCNKRTVLLFQQRYFVLGAKKVIALLTEGKSRNYRRMLQGASYLSNW